MIDFYKADHRRQYPKGTTLVYSNFTPRSVHRAPAIDGLDDRIIFFGLQYFCIWFLQEIWGKEFFIRPLHKVLRDYEHRMNTSLGKGAIPIDHIEALHKLGYLPICIKALPEGTAVPAKVPMLTIHNTNDEFFWLTNYLETALSCMLWKMCTSATTAFKYRQLLDRMAKKTSSSEWFVDFQAHDFSFRGMGGFHDAAMSGAGHLTSFVGTDTVAAIDLVEQYYLANASVELVGCSVPATEHSVMCMAGPEGEFEMFKRLITEVYPKGIVSIVSDSFDFWKVITEFMPALKWEIMARSGGAPVDKVVIRPDSGDPVQIICGNPAAKTEWERKGAVECLWDTFGGKVNDKGYRELDSHVGLIYGDSITLERAAEITRYLEQKGFASTNVVFGVGSYTYQYVTRDTYGFAMKATAGVVNGIPVAIFKDPKTDSGLKKSARGFLKVVEAAGELMLVDNLAYSPTANHGGLLQTVFENGTVFNLQSLAQIRNRIKNQIKV